MVFNLIRHTTIFALALLLSGCASDQEKRTQILECADASNLRNTYTPSDLYGGMVDCVEQNNYSSAVYFFALAGTYSYYDTLRVSDNSAHQAHKDLLQKSLEIIGETRKQALWEELKNTLANPDRLPAICKEIARIGAPRYYPRYMIQLGMDAVTNGNYNEGLIDDFDSHAAWHKSMRNYLHCTGQTVIG